MKKILMIMITIGLALGASAQKRVVVRGGGYHYVRPRVSVGLGLGWGYSPFYSPYGLYSPWYYPPYGYNYGYRPSRLDLTIQDIKTDYADRIKSVRMGEMTRREKRQTIAGLKIDRDKAITQARRDYYYKRSAAPKPADNGSNNGNSNNDHNNNHDSE
ncbi:hypothetical protein HB364_16370 [Pseudoflavitalea sp. X16]|uniref:hypothetical protein n=1 Tax=Paraflavitalea devenefica TaxID=2716334 RepID=UPI001423F3D1|nr:hypothetical protein [Paraflavitalea devenefica]NII26665.1 hypothetical protein [Paraflavitalea devenefica]